MNLGMILTIIGCVGTPLALWQIIDGRRTVKALHRRISMIPESTARVFNSIAVEAQHDSNSDLARCRSSSVDVNGDGVPELLVEFPGGAHSACLKVFSVPNGLEEIGSFYGDTSPFVAVGDFDGDGHIEIATFHRNYASGNSVSDDAIERRYRWNGNCFADVPCIAINGRQSS